MVHVDGEQKLRNAAQRGDVSEVRRLIESGISVNQTGRVSHVYSDCTYICTLLF